MVEKRTVLGRLRLIMGFSDELQASLSDNYPDHWFVERGGAQFFGEFRSTWRTLLLETAEPELQRYFAEFGIPEENLPRLEIEEEYAGSWIVEAAVVMMGTAGTVYTVLKGASELPQIADGLSNLKARIHARFKPQAEEAVEERLQQVTGGTNSPADVRPKLPPRRALLDVDLVIDARPLAGLKPAQLKHHAIHLSVGVSREAFSIENLGDEPITNLRIGLFQSPSERHEWRFVDAFAASVDLLSPKQTLSKPLDSFRDRHGECFEVGNSDGAHVDCWIQDNNGIFLFNFFLEQQ